MSAPSPPQRPDSHLPLVLLAVAVLALLAYRGYGPRLAARPTELQPVAANPVDLNTADKAELVQIPGIGPSLADAIVTHRRVVGRFDRVEELTDVHGIGAKTLDRLRPWLTVGTDEGNTGLFLARGQEPQVERLERKPTPPAARPPVLTGVKLQSGETLNVNTATPDELQRLPGIGPALAARIVAEREQQPFASVEDLQRVSGIGPKTVEKLRPFVLVK
jgi:competence protein ComEA